MPGEKTPAIAPPPESPVGAAFAVGAFLIWGLTPIYFKTLRAIPAIEILMHRMVWSFLLLLPFVVFTNRRDEFRSVISSGRTMLILLATTLLVSSNWFVFIWAINNDRILQTSLGYYINPLINVLLGVVFLKERLRQVQLMAVILAAVGVVYLTVEIGRPPWIALFLAVTFGFYGLIRKVVSVNALVGLTIETLLLSLPAVIYIGSLYVHGSGAFLRIDGRTDILLMCAALVTALPLLLFTIGARKIHFSTVGILQYIAPSCTFLLAVFVYREPFRAAQLWTFMLIWTALLLYSIDSVVYFRRHHSLRR
ncbi:MAG: EamA family transporter RarD [Deltaproteobacteria bacterium]|nr:EamA family transporter RarD [Deltaproteobacteria bacterium]